MVINNMDKKQVILRAAQILFSQFGLKKVTTDDFARESGVSKATIYKYYNNKNEIFLEVVRIETDQMISLIEDAVNKEDTLDGMLKAYLMTKNENIHNLINFYRVTREAWGEHWPFISGVHERFIEKEKQILTRILEHGNKMNVLNITNIALHTHVLLIIFRSIELPWIVADQGTSLNEIVELIVDTFLNGVKKR